jgi:hypothetical protein
MAKKTGMSDSSLWILAVVLIAVAAWMYFKENPRDPLTPKVLLAFQHHYTAIRPPPVPVRGMGTAVRVCSVLFMYSSPVCIMRFHISYARPF